VEMELAHLIQPMLIAGGLSGGAMGTLHYLLRPLNLGRVACYAIGSVTCLLALAGALSTRQSWTMEEVIIMAFGIWTITGAVVALAYLVDGQGARERRAARREHRKG
jgi:uncharacterized membrane protein